jgi:hypothetical protein
MTSHWRWLSSIFELHCLPSVEAASGRGAITFVLLGKSGPEPQLCDWTDPTQSPHSDSLFLDGPGFLLAFAPQVTGLSRLIPARICPCFSHQSNHATFIDACITNGRPNSGFMIFSSAVQTLNDRQGTEVSETLRTNARVHTILHCQPMYQGQWPASQPPPAASEGDEETDNSHLLANEFILSSQAMHSQVQSENLSLSNMESAACSAGCGRRSRAMSSCRIKWHVT